MPQSTTRGSSRRSRRASPTRTSCRRNTAGCRIHLRRALADRAGRPRGHRHRAGRTPPGRRPRAAASASPPHHQPGGQAGQSARPAPAADTGRKAWTTTAGDTIRLRFATATCAPCPVRDQCTRSTQYGRQLTVRPQDQDPFLERVRAEQSTDDWKQRYAARTRVERTVHQAVATAGDRRTRYTGLAKTHLAHILTPHQPDPPQRLVERRPSRPHPHLPEGQTRPRSMRSIGQQG
ncbi:transposase [Streptomyces vinaceus]